MGRRISVATGQDDRLPLGVCILSRQPVRMVDMMPYVTISGDPLQASVLLGCQRIRKHGTCGLAYSWPFLSPYLKATLLPVFLAFSCWHFKVITLLFTMAALSRLLAVTAICVSFLLTPSFAHPGGRYDHAEVLKVMRARGLEALEQRSQYEECHNSAESLAREERAILRRAATVQRLRGERGLLDG
jgi:hypothetical protein